MDSITYTVRIASAARRQFRRLPTQVQNRLRHRIRSLAEDPRPHGVKKLSGEENVYRLRVGDYRVIYQIRDEDFLVLVVKIGHRREVYRRGQGFSC